MLWKKPWELEVVLALISGVIGSAIFGGLALRLLRDSGVPGFHTDFSGGTILLATLSVQGAIVVLGGVFLILQDTSWREVFGATSWGRCLWLAVVALGMIAPIMIGLRMLSGLVMQALGWKEENEMAVDMVLGARPWVRAYLVFWAIVMTPVAEEFLFRGVLFSTAKRYGWTKSGWFGVSFLFALIHANVPAFLPLFVLALALTWLYEKTEGLLAPILAHGLFNLANLVLICVQTS